MTKRNNKTGKRPANAAGNTSEKTWRHHAGQLVELGGRAGISKLRKALGLNTEDHQFFDQTNNSAVPGVGAGWATAGLVGLPPVIAQGTTNLTRVGDSIRVTKMHWRVGVQCGLAQASGTRVRIVGVRRKLSEGAGMTNSIQNNQVFNNNQLLDSQFSPNMRNDGISVFFDKTFNIGAVATDIVGHTLDVVLEDFHMRWTQADTTGVLADLCEGEVGLWIAYDSNLSGALASPPIYTVNRLTEFVDN